MSSRQTPKPAPRHDAAAPVPRPPGTPDLAAGQTDGHRNHHKKQARSPESCRYPPSPHPPQAPAAMQARDERAARTGTRAGNRAAADDTKIASPPRATRG
jgi:hypothetical protein